MNTTANYNFIQKHFIYKGETYNVVMSPELYTEDDNFLDFTGSYIGILISPVKGTLSFQLTPNGDSGWDMELLSTCAPPLTGEDVLFQSLSETLDVPNPTPISTITGFNEQGIVDELDRIIKKSIKG